MTFFVFSPNRTSPDTLVLPKILTATVTEYIDLQKNMQIDNNVKQLLVKQKMMTCNDKVCITVMILRYILESLELVKYVWWTTLNCIKLSLEQDVLSFT